MRHNQNRKGKKNLGLLLVSLLGILLGGLFCILFNYIYQIFDFRLFGIAWNDVAVLNTEIPGDFHLFKHARINPELFYDLFGFYILAYGGFVLIDMIRKVKEMDVEAAILKQESSQAQYLALKNQIDPHFFFNSLSVLSSLVYEDADLSA